MKIFGGAYTAPLADYLRQYAKDSDGIALPCTDLSALRASLHTDKYYPNEIVKKLLCKDLMTDLLASEGFNRLDTRRVRAAVDIDQQDFILKPLVGSGGKASFGNGSKADYRRFHDVQALSDYVSGDFGFLGNGYLIQEADQIALDRTATVSGVVNGKSEVLFLRESRTTWVDLRPTHTTRLPPNDELQIERELLARFVEKYKIRNAWFGLQFLNRNGKWYPIDWNFRLPPPLLIDYKLSEPEELERIALHMLDLHKDTSIRGGLAWEINRGALEFSDWAGYEKLKLTTASLR
jgi:hypothetical protein